MLALIKNLYEDTGFVDHSKDSQLQVYSRIEVLKWACKLGHEDCISNSVRQFQNWRSSPQPDKDNPLVFVLLKVLFVVKMLGKVVLTYYASLKEVFIFISKQPLNSISDQSFNL